MATTTETSQHNSTDDVLTGDDGYLFLYQGAQRQFDYLTGDKKVAADSVQHFFHNLEQRKAYCDEHHIGYLHLVFPSKPVILKDKLPQPLQNKVQSLFLSQYAANRAGPLPDYLLYPQQQLQQLRSKLQVFPRTDTHNSMACMQEIAEMVLHKMGYAIALQDYFTPFVRPRAGDLAVMKGMTEREEQQTSGPLQQPLSFDNISALPANTNNMCLWHNPQSLTSKRLLVFGDSFIKMALIFFSPLFRDILYVRCATFQPDLVSMFAPDQILSSNAERYLSKVASDQQAAPFLLQTYGDSNYQPPAEFIEALVAQLSYRYYPTRYRQWAQYFLPGEIYAETMGAGQLNTQIQVLNLKKGLFFAAGDDPFITFGHTAMQAGRHYQLSFELEAETASVCKVYWCDAGSDGEFSEQRVLRCDVQAGFNQLTLRLTHTSLGQQLRLDPVACRGHFVLRHLQLTLLDIA